MYVLYTIITREYGGAEVIYVAVKGDVSPDKSKVRSGDAFLHDNAEKIRSIFNSVKFERKSSQK